MSRQTVLVAALLGLVMPAAAHADGKGADVARAMLERVVAAVKADPQKAFESFTKGTQGFREGDIYPYCARARSGWVVAHPEMLGDNLALRAGLNGRMFGKEMLQTAEEGKIKEIHYVWHKPGEKTPAQKDTYYTKIDGLVCAVGYYP
jgi:hypothetical protein